MKTPFEFSTYKDFLHFVVDSQPRGTLSRLSEAAGCLRPYLSKVLQADSDVQLTPDHLFGICEHLNLSEIETQYLSLLLEKERASSSRYREHLKKKIAALKNQNLNLKKQIGKEELFDSESSSMAGLYYSHWLFSALHVAVSIPSLQTPVVLAKKFLLPQELILSHLKVLEKMGLVKCQRDRWSWLSGDLHLSSHSQWIGFHHQNWRHQAIQDISLRKGDSIHYSVVQTMSHEDAEKLRLKMSQWIKEYSRVASPSAPEDLLCFNVDFFRVGQ